MAEVPPTEAVAMLGQTSCFGGLSRAERGLERRSELIELAIGYVQSP
jgi:hypothetical protein